MLLCCVVFLIMLYCMVLYCVELYCIVLYCVVLYCVSGSVVLCCIVVLRCVVSIRDKTYQSDTTHTDILLTVHRGCYCSTRTRCIPCVEQESRSWTCTQSARLIQRGLLTTCIIPVTCFNLLNRYCGDISEHNADQG